MKKKLLLILTILLISLVGLSQNFSPKRGVSLGSNTNGYYEYTPSSYDGVTKLPVLITLHGINERGNGNSDLALLTGTGTGLPPIIMSYGFPKQWLVISPQFVNWPTGNDLKSVLNGILSKYPAVDTSRIYVTGLSMGGGALWDWASIDNRLAAIIPICGARDWYQSGVDFMKASKTPVWAFHDNGDPTVPVANTNNWITKLNTTPSIVPVALKTLFNQNTHGTWNTVYSPGYVGPNGMTPWDWMAQYTNNPVAPIPPTVINIPPASLTYINVISGWVHNTTDIYGYPIQIQNTTEQTKFNTERFGEFSYAVPVTNGTYNVKFSFVELYHSASRKRVFDVVLEGATVINDLDLIASFGKFYAYQPSFLVNVTDGVINIVFDPSIDNATISHIEISKANSYYTSVIDIRDSVTNVLIKQYKDTFASPIKISSTVIKH